MKIEINTYKVQVEEMLHLDNSWSSKQIHVSVFLV